MNLEFIPGLEGRIAKFAILYDCTLMLYGRSEVMLRSSFLPLSRGFPTMGVREWPTEKLGFTPPGRPTFCSGISI
jgi:hypothetical protein